MIKKSLFVMCAALGMSATAAQALECNTLLEPDFPALRTDSALRLSYLNQLTPGEYAKLKASETPDTALTAGGVSLGKSEDFADFRHRLTDEILNTGFPLNAEDSRWYYVTRMPVDTMANGYYDCISDKKMKLSPVVRDGDYIVLKLTWMDGAPPKDALLDYSASENIRAEELPPVLRPNDPMYIKVDRVDPDATLGVVVRVGKNVAVYRDPPHLTPYDGKVTRLAHRSNVSMHPCGGWFGVSMTQICGSPNFKR